MTESELKILVTVAGQPEYNSLVQKIKDGTASINEQQKAIKIGTGIYKSWGSENNVLKASLASSLVTMKDTVAQGMQPLTSANGRMMQSYFQTGEALRIQTAFTGFLNKGLQTLGMSTERASTISEGFGVSLGMLTGIIGAVVIAYKLFTSTLEAGEKSARMEMLRSTMQQMAEKDGVNLTNILQQISDKTGGTISQFEILQSVMKLKLLDIGWKQIPDIMQFAHERAKLLGKTFEETLTIIERASLGGQRAIKQLLIPVDVDQSYKDYANTLGVTADELTTIGKQHALFTDILKKGEEQHLNINSAAEQELDKYERLDVAWKNLGKTAGDFATKLTPVVEALASIVNYINNLVSGKLGETYPAIKKKSDDLINAQRAKYGLAPLTGTTFVTDKAPSQIKPKLIGSVVEDPEMEVGQSQDVNWEKVAKRKTEEEKKRLELIKERIRAEEKHDKEQQDQIDWHESALQKEATYIKEAQDAGLITDEQAIEELETLENMVFTEEERVKILKEIQTIKAKSEKDEEKAARDAQKALKDEQDRILATGTFSERMKLYSKEMKKNFDINKLAAEGLQNAIAGITDEWGNALSGLIQGTLNIGQAFKTMGQAVIEEIETIIARLIAMKAIELILSLIPGGQGVAAALPAVAAVSPLPHAKGGWLNEPVVGVGMSTGRIHTFAEKQPEYISTINQMSQTSRGGGSGVIVSIQRVDSRIQGTDIVQSYILTQQGRKGRKG